MTPQSRLIVGINLLLLLGWTGVCRSLPQAGSADQLSFTLPMAGGILMLLLLNLGGIAWANSSRQEPLRQAFGMSLLVVLLIGFGLCGWAKPSQ